MKHKSLILFSFALVFLFMAGCRSPRRENITEIENIEKSLFDQESAIDRTKVGELIDLYVRFADTYPDDSLSPAYLFKAGDMAMNTNRSQQAIEFYKRIIDNYPDYPKVPEALFLQGYVYENNLGRLDEAKRIYEQFLELYPENDFADDARVSLQFLGKTPEELIEIFQQQSAPAAE
ncbi:MAG: tetratricopeptide repeat protein [Sphingobacteriia bacterium]|nr:tetratricopeptide repeat protein [Sphingobacteriia bacterium]